MSQDYEVNSAFIAYIKWHYGRGLSELFEVAGNLLWFVKNFFSFHFLLSNIFAPIRNPEEAYDEDFNPKSAAAIKNLMRPIGFIGRVIVILIGALSYVFVIALFVPIFIIWILAPLVLLGSLVISATFFAV